MMSWQLSRNWRYWVSQPTLRGSSQLENLTNVDPNPSHCMLIPLVVWSNCIPLHWRLISKELVLSSKNVKLSNWLLKWFHFFWLGIMRFSRCVSCLSFLSCVSFFSSTLKKRSIDIKTYQCNAGQSKGEKELEWTGTLLDLTPPRDTFDLATNLTVCSNTNTMFN